MAYNQGHEELNDELFEHMMSLDGYNSGGGDRFVGYGSGISHGPGYSGLDVGGLGLGLPLGLNLDHGSSSTSLGVSNTNIASSSSSRINEMEPLGSPNLFPAFGHLQSHSIRVPPPSIRVPPTFQSRTESRPAQSVSHQPTTRPRMRAKRGHATDPHSIAERQRRERIAERVRGLQELLPNCNKTDRAAMLDEIVDYVKFLSLQVKVLSMSRLGGAAAVAQLIANMPQLSIQGEGVDGGQAAWDKWSNDGTEEQVAKLMEEDIGAAMQFLQSKELCLMPISLASAIFRSQPQPMPPPPRPVITPETNPPP